MARRRINTKFLGISFAGIVILAGGGYVGRRFLIHHDPAQFIKAGDMFAKQKDWQQAVANYGVAAQMSPKDAPLWVKLGEAEMQLRAVDRDQAMAAVSAWNHATEIDPNYLPAWQHLLTVYQDDLTGAEMTRRTNAGYFARTREVALQCVRLNAKDPAIAGVPLELDLRMWLDNIPLPAVTGEQSGLTDAQRADRAITELQKLKSLDAQFPYWVAKAQIRQGEEALHDDQTTIAYGLFEKASKAFDDPITQHPKDIKLYLSQFDTLTELMSMDNRPDARKAYERKRRDSLEHAQTQIDPTDPLYPVVKTQFASLIAPSDPPRAEAIYKDLIAKYPTNYGLRVSLAGLLGAQPRRADDAVAVLAQLPDQPPATVTGNARLAMEEQLTDARLTRASIQAQKLTTAATPVERDKLNDAINADVAAVPQRFLSDWHVLQAIGKIQLMQNKVRDAIQTLEHASERLKLQDPNRREVSLMLDQADAYRAGGQTTQAISLYDEALKDPRAAANPLPHLRLAQLYLSQNNRSAAVVQVDWLKQRFPYDVQVVSLEIGTLDKTADHDQIIKLYSGLPEVDDGAKLRKVEVARQIGSAPEMARLLNDVYNDHPGDQHIAFDLARADLAINRPDAAKQVLRESLKVNPDSTTLKLLDEQLNNATPAVRDATARQGIEALKDPVAREQQLAQYADNTGKPPEAIEHLQKALTLAPKNGQIAGDLFSHYLVAHKYKEAQSLLDLLTSLDADQAHGLVYQFNYAFARQDVTTALTIGRQLIRDFPEFSGSWSSLGQALEAAGQTEDAASKYLSALQRQGTNYVALRHLVNCCYQLNRISDAQQYIAQGRQRFPNDQAFRQLEIEHMLNFGDPQDAVEVATNALKASPDDRASYLGAAEVLSRASATVRAKGNADAAAQDLVQARDVLKQALDRWPDDPTFVVPYASSLNATGDFEGGEATIRDFGNKPAWKDRPDIPIALAHYYQSAGKADQATPPLREALRLSHDSLAVHNELIANLVGEHKFDDALAELHLEQPSADVDKERVQVLLESNRLAEAETAARAGMNTYPQDASFQNLLGLSLLRQNKVDDAASVVQAAIKADDQNAGAHYVRAMVDIARKPPATDEALHDLQFVLSREPGNSSAATALADLQVMAGDVDSATHALETSLRASPSSKDIRLKLVELYSRANPPRWDDATRVVELGLAYGSNRNDPDLLRADAMVWARRGTGDKAVASIRAALKVAPNRPDFVHDYFTILLLTHNDAQLLEESQAILNNPPVPWWAYASRATALVHTGDTASATAQYDLALTAAGASNNAATVDAVVAQMVQDLGAGKTLELVQPRAQNSVTWKLESVSLLNQSGDKAQAMTLLDQAMSTLNTLPPQQQASTLQLAGSLYLANQPPMVDKAVSAYKKLLDLQPNNMMALNNLAYLLSEMSKPPQPAQALVYSQRAYDGLKAQGRVEPLVYDTQGWVLILDGRVDDGIDVLHQVIDKAPFPDAHYHLAMGYLQKKLPTDAQRELLAADELIDDAVNKKRSVDATLKGKVAAALREATQMQDAKTQSK